MNRSLEPTLKLRNPEKWEKAFYLPEGVLEAIAYRFA